MRKILGLGLIFLLAACGSQSAPRPTATPFMGEPRSVIIDTDMAADDWMAILYLLQRPDLSVEAITVTGTGESHCEPGVKHALELAALAGHPDIPVSCGRETPLQGNHTFPTAWRMNVDELAGLTLPDNPTSPASQPAAELLTTTIQSSPEKTIILTLGPLTNLAEALRTTPDLKDKIEMVYIMGGAVDVSGNVGNSRAGINNPSAEWNVYVDPHAAAIVFQSGVPITLVPLDATNDVPVTRDFVSRLKNDQGTPEATFVFEVLTQYHDFIRSGGYSFWDPLAASILTENSLATFEARTLIVIEEEGIDSGRTQASEAGASIRVAVSADGERFEQLFLDTLNRPE
ncbi:MAG TPA: nucleoside hydrolase [Anaerolineales bacterium]|nr:nucleoside hydrolase [Anaerolineales bacterium]